MSRIARSVESNSYYHVISRSVNETVLLKTLEDFSQIKRITLWAKQKFPLKIFHYVFMPTHFHLVVKTIARENLSKNLQFLKWHYSQWMHKKHGWKGPLWRERYKNLLIADDYYLAACGMYVEFNPVRAHLCSQPCEYPHSSAHKYTSAINDPLLDEHNPLFDFSLEAKFRLWSKNNKKLFSQNNIGIPNKKK